LSLWRVCGTDTFQSCHFVVLPMLWSVCNQLGVNCAHRAHALTQLVLIPAALLTMRCVAAGAYRCLTSYAPNWEAEALDLRRYVADSRFSAERRFQARPLKNHTYACIPKVHISICTPPPIYCEILADSGVLALVFYRDVCMPSYSQCFGPALQCLCHAAYWLCRAEDES
jgi:hypothetical protein